MKHQDSAGNSGVLKPGWVQWMTAGSGVVHSEMPSDEVLKKGGRSEGFQLWVNLPAKDKMIKPRYQDTDAKKIPVVTSEGTCTVERLLSCIWQRMFRIEKLWKVWTQESFQKVEIKENGKIPFLDCLVTRDNNKLKTTIYRKPTHTDRLLDQSLYNPTSHKATTIRTLTRRAQLVCNSPDSLQDETDYLNVFSKNNYNTDFVRRNTHGNTDSNSQTNSGPVTTATIPYIRGTSETLLHVYYNLTIYVLRTNR